MVRALRAGGVQFVAHGVVLVLLYWHGAGTVLGGRGMGGGRFVDSLFSSGDLFCCKLSFDFVRVMRLCVYFYFKSAFMDGKSFSNVFFESWELGTQVCV